jgi:hypothetical protein
LSFRCPTARSLVWDHIKPERLIDTDGRQWTVNYGLTGGMLEAELLDPPEYSLPPSLPDVVYVPEDWVDS